MKQFPYGRVLACLTGTLALLATGTAVAQQTTFDETIPLVDRPLSLKKGHAEFGMDLMVDLTRGQAGEHVVLGSGYLSDRYDGLSIAYGVSDQFEIGLGLEMLWWEKGKGLDILGGVYVFVKWAFVDFLGIEVGLHLPSKSSYMERLVVFRGSILLSAPLKYTIVPDILAIHARPDIWIGFAKTGYHGFTSESQVTVFADLGLTANITPELFLDVSVGVGKPGKGYDTDPVYDTGNLFRVQGLRSRGTDLFLPVSVWMGYTVIPSLDLGLSFTFQDLYGTGIDSRNLTITSAFRF